MSKTIVAIDCSGGLSAEHLEFFFKKLETIDFDHIVGFDHAISFTASTIEEARNKLRGGGGTNYLNVDAYCMQAGATKIVLMSDGWVPDFFKREGVEYELIITDHTSLLAQLI